MSDIEDKKLDFVLKHYQEGKFDTQKAIDRFNKAHGIEQKPRRRVLPWVSGIVAAAAAVALGVFLFIDGQKTVEVYAMSDVQEVVLPDGTEISLAPGSMLSYKEKSPRSVQLDGKAYFEVARNKTVPFEVKADGVYVKVLGTKFLVDAAGDSKEVYVTEGKVFFARKSDAEGVILTKDMQAVLSETDAVPVIGEADVNTLAWQRGTFIFDQTPLKEVLDCLSEYYGVAFAADHLDRCLSGEFISDDLDLILTIIESALDVTIIKK